MAFRRLDECTCYKKWYKYCGGTEGELLSIALSCKCANYGYSVLKLFTQNNKNVNFSDSKGNTPLQLSMQKKYFDIAKELIRLGADVNKPRYSITPLRWAIRHNSEEMVNFLLENGAQRTINSAFLEAISCSNLQLTKLLRQRGAQVNIEEIVEFIPLILAVQKQHFEIVEFLLKEGADVNEKNETGLSPLTEAIKDEDTQFDIIEALVEAGANVNEKDEKGITPLVSAIERELVEIVELLVNNGANVNERNEAGTTPLVAAVEEKAVEIVELLLNNGADVDEIHENGTPLTLAVEKKCSEIVKLLVNEGHSDVNKMDSKGRSPLNLAIQENDFEIVDCLLKAGANVYGKDEKGVTPVYIAAERRNLKLFDVLVESGGDEDPPVEEIRKISKVNLDLGVNLLMKRDELRKKREMLIGNE